MDLKTVNTALIRSGLTKTQIAARLDLGPAYYGQILRQTRELSRSVELSLIATLILRAQELLNAPTTMKEERDLNVAFSTYLLALSQKEKRG